MSLPRPHRAGLELGLGLRDLVGSQHIDGCRVQRHPASTLRGLGRAVDHDGTRRCSGRDDEQLTGLEVDVVPAQAAHFAAAEAGRGEQDHRGIERVIDRRPQERTQLVGRPGRSFGLHIRRRLGRSRRVAVDEPQPFGIAERSTQNAVDIANRLASPPGLDHAEVRGNSRTRSTPQNDSQLSARSLSSSSLMELISALTSSR